MKDVITKVFGLAIVGILCATIYFTYQPSTGHSHRPIVVTSSCLGQISDHISQGHTDAHPVVYDDDGNVLKWRLMSPHMEKLRISIMEGNVNEAISLARDMAKVERRKKGLEEEVELIEVNSREESNSETETVTEPATPVPAAPAAPAAPASLPGPDNAPTPPKSSHPLPSTAGSSLADYEKHDGWQITSNYVVSHPDCQALGEQCSTTLENAPALCNKIENCVGFVCNQARSDCQIRTSPLVHLPANNFASYYKPGAFNEAQDNRKQAESKLKAGSVASPDFNPKGKCGTDHKCVISYGLYGSNPKYIEGAIRNAELVPQIYPGWVMRCYHDDSVPAEKLAQLKNLGVEFEHISNINGDIAGMFWRFLVADDATVDRYIIRDSDSRLNWREKHAVDEWIASGFSIHSIRDHPNHDRPLNGGMWGGVKGAVKGMKDMVSNSNRNGYGADLGFLNDRVWPQVQYDQISHDSYSCQKYLNSHPFPDERKDYQHVGQVFENDQPRMSDITCCMVNNHAPLQCRKKPEWLYG